MSASLSQWPSACSLLLFCFTFYFVKVLGKNRSMKINAQEYRHLLMPNIRQK